MHKNENRPGYKKTKVGWIPEGWRDSRLKDCAAKIGSGITPKGGSETYLPVGIPLIRSQNVLDGEFSSDGLIYISDKQHRAMKGSALQPNDVLFNITGASIGRCCLFPAHFGEANVNQHVCIVRLKNTCHPKLFVNILNSHIAKRQLHENQAGGGREGLNFQNMGGFRIPHPSLPEQEAIAEVLECWDKGIRTLENKIVKKRLIKKGLMQRLLAGMLRLPGFGAEYRIANSECRIPKGWKNAKLGKISAIRKGQQLSRIDQTETGEYPVLNGGVEPLGYTDKWNTEENTITISEGGNSCGFVNFNTEKFWCGGHCYALAEDESKAVKPYLFQFLKHKEISIMRLRVGSGLPNIQKKALEHFEIALPPLEEQRAIAEVLAAADGEIEALEWKLALWKDQKKFLLNNLVTGTMRLPEFKN